MDFHITNREVKPLAMVATELRKVKSDDRKPAQQTSFDIAQKTARLNKTDTEKVIKELNKLGIARMTEEHVIAIATFLPQSPDELKTIFAGTKTTIKSEDLAKILDIIPKY